MEIWAILRVDENGKEELWRVCTLPWSNPKQAKALAEQAVEESKTSGYPPGELKAVCFIPVQELT